ncbi:PREDICTED: CST complex subunit CTC1 isoform X2 [Nelumbo nucifera]|uniref:CST complex subunit CTC1 n=1 Tax=Nelumbo nucifera TaxID=4432 RepID=A0A1U7YUP5_NELNU|nr:PREDICTED: CST complex subunit CTC1 isoform X2 [Nelumbo nucifera]
MDGVKIVTIAELLKRSRPLTGASSIHLSSSSTIFTNGTPTSRIPSERSREFQLLVEAPTTSFPCQKPNPNVLSSLNHPTLIIGNLNLPSSDGGSTSIPLSCSSRYSCFIFSDGSSTVCCDVLDIDFNIVGKQIHVLAWNFVPFKYGDCGFLEIVRWSLPDTTVSNLDAFPLGSTSSVCKEHFKAGSRIFGRLESVSPVSVVPCTVQNRTSDSESNCGQNSSSRRNMSGFLVEMMLCECPLCGSKALENALHDSVQGKSCHAFLRPVFVYLFGSASSWHPALYKLIGNVVLFTGLKKKLIFTGKESYAMFTTTDKALLHLPRLPALRLPFRSTLMRGKGELDLYTGIITGVYMQGMVVELDGKVWLLLTDLLLVPPHSLRVGSLISLKNVHFVQPKFSWTKVLLLGACYKTCINVKSFSPLEPLCHIQAQKQSLLRKFIDSLVFSARLWLLLMVSSFRKKFSGILSEKDILGSKHKVGLVQMYATSYLPPCVFQPRHGVFMEFCKHDECGCGSESNYADLKLVVPISNLVGYCEAMWVKLLAQMDSDSDIMGNSRNVSLSCEEKSYGRLIRRIFSSKDIGVVLMGNLQISPSSGRLQLSDVTGSIDVVIPDFPSNWDVSSIYEVQDYSLVFEGLPTQTDSLGLLKGDPFSCNNIFHHVPFTRKIDRLAIYAHFYLKDANRVNVPLHTPSMGWSGNLKGLESGMFHLLFITHKFPAMQHLQGDPITSNMPSLFVEAMMLPWDLFLPLENGGTHPSNAPMAKLKEDMKYNVTENLPENLCNKRLKIAPASSRPLTSVSLCDLGKSSEESYNCLGDCFSPYWKFSTNQKAGSSNHLLEMPCFVTARAFDHQNTLRSGILYRKKPYSKDCIGANPSFQKVLLEFKFEGFFNYQYLRIGQYYILKQCMEELPCNSENHGNLNNGQALITSTSPLWSLSFFLHGTLSCEPPYGHPPDVYSSSNTVILSDGSSKLLFQEFPGQSPETCSDVNLYLSSDAMNLLKVDIETLEKQSGMTFVAPVEAINFSVCIGIKMTVPGSAIPDCRLPEGNLISLHGHIVDVHNFDCNSVQNCLRYEAIGDIHHLKFFQGLPSNVCIHLSNDCNIVRIHGNLCKLVFPIGMGPGASATFHRLLVLGQYELMLTPVSFIVINSVKEVNHLSDTCSHQHPSSDDSYDSLLETTPCGLIYELQCLESKTMRFNCRVLAINVLVLEKSEGKFEKLPLRKQSKTLLVRIPLAGFVLDDGSSSFYCWANAKRAATMLRLYEKISDKALNSSCWRLKRTQTDKATSTAIYYLDKILSKYNRIIVKNCGAALDSPCQDLTFSVTSDNVFSSSDENLLKFIILNACGGSVLNVEELGFDSEVIFSSI